MGDPSTSQTATSERPHASSVQLYRRLIGLYVQGSCVAVLVTLFLVLLGLEFTGRQWFLFLSGLTIGFPAYVILDIVVIKRHYRPLGEILTQLDEGRQPTRKQLSIALVRALNLPFYSAMRVTFLHGPAAAVAVFLVASFTNLFFDAGFEVWQIVILVALILFFASPTHAIYEFFSITRRFARTAQRLWTLAHGLDDRFREEVISIRLRSKLLYFSTFITTLPLLFFSGSVLFKVDRLIETADGPVSIASLLPWILGVTVVCVAGATTLSHLLAREVAEAAAALNRGMRTVEKGSLDLQLPEIATDEYADLFRGFNLMTEGLRDEVEILGITNDLCGEVNLDRLFERVMRATTDLLEADRSTLFLHDPKTDELFSRFAERIGDKVIRIPSDAGIAGSVFRTGKVANVTDPQSDPRFNPEVDRETGYQTESILCMPIVNKKGDRIGVTQVLNKHGGQFTHRDEARLRAFTNQIAVALENAQLFEDVLNIKNYNESILASTTNGIVTLNEESRVVTVNDAGAEILQTDREELVDRTADAIFRQRNQWILAKLEGVRATGQAHVSMDADLQVPTGESRSVNLTMTPLLDTSHQSQGSILMLEDLTEEKRVKTTMARYMSKEVAEQLLEGETTQLGGTNQEVSVLFSDIRGFTSISERIGPKETVSMLNEYFGRMVDVVFRHHGILDKYIGDAIMALFGAPFTGPEDADNALRVANDMLSTLRELNEDRIRRKLDPIDIGVGISTGDVVLGNIGSSKRLEYTAIGDPVNLASRLEGANKFYGTHVLISEFTKRRLGDSYRLREVDRIRVKGKDEPVAVYEALDHHDPKSYPRLDEAMDAFGEGIQLYRDREWNRSVHCFETVVQCNGQDPLPRIYIDRCRHYLQQCPGPEWDGVWVLTEK